MRRRKEGEGYEREKLDFAPCKNFCNRRWEPITNRHLPEWPVYEKLITDIIKFSECNWICCATRLWEYKLTFSSAFRSASTLLYHTLPRIKCSRGTFTPNPKYAVARAAPSAKRMYLSCAINVRQRNFRLECVINYKQRSWQF